VAAGVAVFALISFGLGRRGGAASPRSVGVIPFTNLSEAKGNEYFSEGVTQEIATALGKVPGLQVASDESSSNGGARDRRALARALGVESLVEGSVQNVNGRVRVTARLIKPDGAQLWGDSYDRELKDVFAVQDEIVHAIVAGLKMTLTGGASRTLVRTETADPEAHRLYLEGMYYWNRRTGPLLRRSMGLFRQAIARDSNYASAWAGLSLSYAVIITYAPVDVQATSDTALAAGLRALAIDSTSSDGMLGVAQARFQTGHRAEGLRDFERAVALDSNNARVRHWYAEALASAGMMEEALKQIHAAEALEPLSLTINTNVGRVELEARHYREAEAAIDHVLELDSTFIAALSLKASLYEDLGRYDDAIAMRQRQLRVMGGAGTSSGLMTARSYALAGRGRQADSLLADVRRRVPADRISYGALAVVYDALGRRSEALAALDTAVARNDALLVMSSRQKMYDPFRKDPRGKALLDRLEAVR
jgi:serine/threonine-protein kinase